MGKRKRVTLIKSCLFLFCIFNYMLGFHICATFNLSLTWALVVILIASIPNIAVATYAERLESKGGERKYETPRHSSKH